MWNEWSLLERKNTWKTTQDFASQTLITWRQHLDVKWLLLLLMPASRLEICHCLRLMTSLQPDLRVLERVYISSSKICTLQALQEQWVAVKWFLCTQLLQVQQNTVLLKKYCKGHLFQFSRFCKGNNQWYFAYGQFFFTSAWGHLLSFRFIYVEICFLWKELCWAFYHPTCDTLNHIQNSDVAGYFKGIALPAVAKNPETQTLRSTHYFS